MFYGFLKKREIQCVADDYVAPNGRLDDSGVSSYVEGVKDHISHSVTADVQKIFTSRAWDENNCEDKLGTIFFLLHSDDLYKN